MPSSRMRVRTPQPEMSGSARLLHSFAAVSCRSCRRSKNGIPKSLSISGPAIVDLAEAGLDIAIRSGQLDGLPGHVRLPWFEFDWLACASPGYLEQHRPPRTPSDLSAHDLIGFRNTSTGLIEHWRLRDDSFPRPPSWHFVSDDAESALLAAIHGGGIMWGPRWLAADALASGSVSEVLSDWRGNRMAMSILRRGQKLLPTRVRVVMEFLRSQAATFESGASD